MKNPMPMMLKMIMILSILIAVYGAILELKVGPAETSFHAAQVEYLVDYTKAQRDSAVAGSDLAQLHADIANTPSQLMYMKLGGIASILVGIFLLLMAILKALTMMPAKLAEQLKK